MQRWGRIDFLHNNVGIGGGDSDPLGLSEESFERIIAVNLKGCLLSCQAVMPGLLDTPMAVDARAATLGIPRGQVVAQRDAISSRAWAADWANQGL